MRSGDLGSIVEMGVTIGCAPNEGGVNRKRKLLKKLRKQEKVMILIDRIVQFLKKDIYLPLKCYANKRQFTNPRDGCTCKNFCRKPPSGGSPVYVKIEPKYGQKYNYTK